MLGVTRVTGSQIITRLNNYFFVNEQYFFSRTIVIIRATKKLFRNKKIVLATKYKWANLLSQF